MTDLLLTSIYYEPDATGIGPYATRVAEHLAARGYRVTAVTGMPHYPAWRIDEHYRGRQSVREFRGGVDVRRYRQFVPSGHGAAGRALYETTHFASILPALALPARRGGPHAVVGIVPALGDGLLARIAAARFRVPYGIVFQDLIGPAASQGGVRGGARVASAVRLAEGWVARGAAAVGIVAEGFRPYVESLGVDPTRVRRLRNWHAPAVATLSRDEVRAMFGLPLDAAVALHAGNIGHKQGLENIVECARLAAAAGAPVYFVIAGDGARRAAIEALLVRLALPNISLLPVQPAEIHASLLAAADVLLVNQPAAVRDMALPSKLASYFAASVPVVAAAASDSETASEVRWSGGGIVAPPDSPSALLAEIQRVLDDRELARYLGNCGRAWAREHLGEASALRGYEQLVAAVLAGARRGRVHTGTRMPARREDTRAA